MKLISRLIILSLLFLSSCKKFQNFVMVPAQHRENRDCVYHKYGGLPHCKKYHFIAVDKQYTKKTKQKPITDYQQYRGNFKYAKKSAL